MQSALHLPTYLYFRVKNECSLPRLEKCVFFFFFNSNLTCLYYVQYIHKHIIEAIPFLFSDLDGQLEFVPQCQIHFTSLELSYYCTVNDEQTKAGDQCLMNCVEECRRKVDSVDEKSGQGCKSPVLTLTHISTLDIWLPAHQCQ